MRNGELGICYRQFPRLVYPAIKNAPQRKRSRPCGGIRIQLREAQKSRGAQGIEAKIFLAPGVLRNPGAKKLERIARFFAPVGAKNVLRNCYEITLIRCKSAL
jgi:hypothetical protein